MKHLWAPWRSAYITSNPEKATKCFLCQKLKEQCDKKSLIIKRGEYCFAVLNLFPYNAGHLLIAPLAHKANLEDLTDRESGELFSLTLEMKRRLSRVMKPAGFNIGFNLGNVAGAGLASHLHLHLVPRWPGDTNFMPVVAATKVISQSLDKVYKELCRSAVLL
jgi:ATP adenylyltransferase